MVIPQDDACVRNTVAMSSSKPQPAPSAGGNLYVGPSLGSSLVRAFAFLAAAPQR